jgi:hypothetical protein
MLISMGEINKTYFASPFEPVTSQERKRPLLLTQKGFLEEEKFIGVD